MPVTTRSLRGNDIPSTVQRPPTAEDTQSPGLGFDDDPGEPAVVGTSVPTAVECSGPGYGGPSD